MLSPRKVRCAAPQLLGPAQQVPLRLVRDGMFSIGFVAPARDAAGEYVTYPPTNASTLFAYTNEWTAHAPGFGDRLGSPDERAPAITVSGFGFAAAAQYRCQVSTEQDAYGRGARTQRSPVASCISSEELVCETPEWDLATPWADFTSYLVNISVWELLPSQGASWTEVFSRTGRTLPGQMPFRYENINRPPAFAVSRVTVYSQGTMSKVVLDDFATQLRGGVVASGRTVKFEAAQSLTFDVVPDWLSLFAVTPTLHANGTLEFSLAPKAFGTAILKVTLRDDGGTERGGGDRSFQTVEIVIKETEWNFAPQMTLSHAVDEGAGRVILAGFLDLQLSAISEGFLGHIYTKYFANVTADSVYFEEPPSVSLLHDQGTLSFKVRPFAFGTVDLTVQVWGRDGASGSLTTDYFTDTLSLTIHPVNQPPAFSLNLASEIITVHEDEYAATEFVLPDIVMQLTRGPPINVSGPDGEDWPEAEQKVSYRLKEGASALFAMVPHINASGALHFLQAPNRNGETSLSFAVQDSGGTARGGRDISAERSFTVIVTPVNDPPTFELACPDGHRLASCNNPCTKGELAGCTLDVMVLENCADCDSVLFIGTNEESCTDCGETRIPGCARPFVLERVAQRMRPSAPELADEALQTLSFVFDLTQGDAALFAPGGFPRFEHSGDLLFCLARDTFGEVNVSIWLEDSGGTAHGGQNASEAFTLRVLVADVNQPPHFDVPDEHAVCASTGALTFPGFAANITAANIVGGVRTEADQALTFAISVPANASAIFSVPPHIDSATGDLSFELLYGQHGEMVLGIHLEDNGGTLNEGRNKSERRSLRLFVYDSYVQANVTIVHSAATPPSAQAVADSFADALGVPPFLVSATVAAGALPGIALVQLEAYATSSELSQELQRDLPSAAPDVAVALGALSATVNASRLLMTYCGNVAAFALDRDEVVIAQHESSPASPFVEEEFAVNVTSPPDTLLDENLTEIVRWEFIPLRHRVLGGSWVADGTSGPLVAFGPRLVGSCTPICTHATLIFAPNEDFWGEVEFLVNMSGAHERSESFRIEVLYANAPPEFVLVNDTLVFSEGEAINVFLVDFVQNVSGGRFLSDAGQTVELQLEPVTAEGEAAFTDGPNLVLINSTANLSFSLGIEEWGNFTVIVVAEDDGEVGNGGSNRTEVNFTIMVTPINDAPGFTVDCGRRGIETIANAEKCVKDVDGALASATVTVHENCFDCGSAPGITCDRGFQLEAFAGSISAHGGGLGVTNEDAQALSFIVESLDRNASDMLFGPDARPHIDPMTGTLSFCLQPHVDGEASFSVLLIDDGGTARGGQNTSRNSTVLTVVVKDINSPPSFDACCEQKIVLCSDGGYHRIPAAALDVRAGPRREDGSDSEPLQNVTFTVVADDPALFAIQPWMNASGDLELTLGGETNATFSLTITLRDDGGTEDGGVDTSTAVVMKGFFYDTYVDVPLRLQHAVGALSVNDTLLQQISAAFASDLGIESVIVKATLMENKTTNWNETVLQVRVLTFSSDEALNVAEEIANYNAINETNATVPCGNVTLEDCTAPWGIPEMIDVTVVVGVARAFKANCQNVPGFTIPDPKVPITQFLYPGGTPLRRAGFITNITVPANAPLGEAGDEDVRFSVRPVRYRAFQGIGEWVEDGTDGGLLYGTPNVTTVCSETAGCSSATLELAQVRDMNGEAEYEVRMDGTEAYGHFKVAVKLSFTIMDSFVAYEDEEDSLVPEFMLLSFVGADDTDGEVPIRFLVTQVDGDPDLLLSAPTVALSLNGTGELRYELRRGHNGNATFSLQAAHANGYDNSTTLSAPVNFSMEVLPVNSQPTFSVPPELVVYMHQYPPAAIFDSDTVVTGISAGPPDEAEQDLTLKMEALTLPAALFDLAPNVSLDLLSNGSWIVGLSFSTMPWQYGEVLLTLTLSDDGGTEDGGEDYLELPMLLRVLPVNQQPTFELNFTLVEVNESVAEGPAAIEIPTFAQNISAGRILASERTQNLTFVVMPALNQSLNASEIFLDLPGLSVDGTLSFVPQRFAYGVVEFEVVLKDDGGVGGGGIDTSTVSRFNISLLPINQPPSFEFASLVVELNESQSNASSCIRVPDVAHSISAGPREEWQAVSFRVEAIGARVPAYGPWGNTSDLFGAQGGERQLLEPSSLFLDASGALWVCLTDFRNGEVVLSILLEDDGGEERGGENASSQQNLTLRVLPVNSAPRFNLTQSVAEAAEDVPLILSSFVLDVDPGGWREEAQLLHFSVVQVDGPAGVLATAALDCSGADAPRCRAGDSATLRVSLDPDRYGNLSLRVILRDDGGVERSGTDETAQTLDLIALPVNDPPAFSTFVQTVTVLENSACITRGRSYGEWEAPGQAECDTSIPYFHRRTGLVTSISWGPFENGDEDCGTCELQTGWFVLTPLNATDAERIFATLPNVSLSTGSLELTLIPHMNGEVRFNMTLYDLAPDGSSLNITRELLVRVLPVNSPPGFKMLETTVEVFEDAGSLVLPGFASDVTTDGTSLDTEPEQEVTFELSFDRPDLFLADAPPRILHNGTLLLTVAPDVFGVAHCTLLLRDNGGVAFAGVPVSDARAFRIFIRAVNDAPSFVIPPLATVLQHSGSHSISGFASSIRVGPPNEACAFVDDFCRNQTATFVVDDVSDPSLFRVQPYLGVDGTLIFAVAPRRSGGALVTVRLEDDGGTIVNISQQFAGEDTTPRQSFRILVEAQNTLASFRLPWTLDCRNPADECGCSEEGLDGVTCRRSDPAGMLESTMLNASIRVREGRGQLTVPAFATHITTAEGFLASSIASFDVGAAGNISFRGARSDERARVAGFEYATDHVVSADGRFVYAAELETDTLSVFSNTPGGGMQFIDRIGHRMRRYRFREGPPPLNPSFSSNQGVCAWESFESGGEAFVLAASGCQRLEDYNQHLDNSTCSDRNLGAQCDAGCCVSLLAATAGFWDLSSASMFGEQRVNPPSRGEIDCSGGFCTYTRPRNGVACEEANAVRIGPATFRDQVNRLGAAAVLAPSCKVDRQTDWDGPPGQVLSAASFLVNDGRTEAVQFDGTLNAGLVVAPNIDSLVTGDPATSKLPLEALAVEVWFEIATEKPGFYGLAAAQQDGTACRKGWSLGHSGAGATTLITFQISLEGRDTTGYGVPFFARLTVEPGIRRGEWNHLAVTYDGASVAMYYNGELALDVPACDAPPCGRIIYPAAYHPSGQCIAKRTELRIGAYQNAKVNSNFPHIGSIKSVRILSRSLSAAEVRYMYGLHAPALRNATMPTEEYWSRALGHLNGPISPSSDFSNVAEDAPLSLLGRFLTAAAYRCVFLRGDIEIASAPGSLSCSTTESEAAGTVCPEGRADTLTCETPFWEHGFAATTLAIDRSDGPASGWTRLWQRVCLTGDCGFVPYALRKTSTWWTFGARTLLNPALEGALTPFRFTAESRLYRYDPSLRAFELASTLSGVRSCLSASCVYNQRTCQSGVRSGLACTSDADCGNGASCGGLERFAVEGAASISHVEIDGRSLLLVANFWDGQTSIADSSVLEISAGGGEPALLQRVATFGARRWAALTLGARTLLVVANFARGLALHAHVGGAQPISPLPVLQVPLAGCADLAIFTVGNASFAAAAVFHDGSPAGASRDAPARVLALGNSNGTHLFAPGVLLAPAPDALWASPDGITAAALLTTLAADAAMAVVHFVIGDRRFLAFASFADAPSPMYASPAGASPPQFSLLQLMPTRWATALDVFVGTDAGEESPYLAVAQRDAGVLVLRWNGSAFLGPLDDTTENRDVAAGQDIASDHPRAVRQVRLPAADFLLIGGAAADARVLQGYTSYVAALAGPSSLALAPDGRNLYVACARSRAVAVFVRDAATGLLTFSDEASFVTTHTADPVGDSTPAAPAVLAPARFGAPLRSAASLALSPDGRNLYVAAFGDNATLTFAVNATTGALVLAQTLRDGEGGVDGIAGAAGVAVSPDGLSVLVAGYLDNAVAMFARDPAGGGLLAPADRLKAGERLFERFSDATDDAVPAGSAGGAWSSGDFPRFPLRLGGNAQSWSFAARDAAAFSMFRRVYIAVAASAPSPEAQGGALAIYTLDEERGGALTLLQTRAALPAVSAVAHVGLNDRSGHRRHYLVVGAAYSRAQPAPTVEVLGWSPAEDEFAPHHTLTRFADDVGLPLHVGDLESFSLGGVPHLAVAFHSSGATGDVPSYLYRWNSSEVRQADGHTRVVGFEPVQVFPTSGATAATFLAFGAAQTPVLAFASSLGRDEAKSGGASHRGAVVLFRYDAEAGAFVPLQTIPAWGAAGLDAFSVPGAGGGDFLVIANRQSQVPANMGDLTVYDQVPELYRWNENTGSLVLHQRLEGGGFESVSDDSAGLAARDIFCAAAGCVPGDDGHTRPVPFLRGATGVTAFAAGGETYLAVAQSLCENGDAPDECPVQPKSAVLQWNRAVQRFGPMLSLEEGESVKDSGRELPASELATHAYSLRINAGRAARFVFLEAGDLRLLVLCSHTRGAVVLEWDFEKVAGLRGAVSVASGGPGGALYAVAADDAAVVHMERTIRVDAVGRAVRVCAGGCLSFRAAIGEAPLRRSRTAESPGGAEGLRGARRAVLGEGGRGVLEVRGGLPRAEMECAAVPPASADGAGAAASGATEAACQRLSFTLEALPGGNGALLAAPPAISAHGVLTLTLAEGQSGSAAFRVELDDGSESRSRFFVLEAAPVNDAPVFRAADVFSIAKHSASFSNVFAVGISAGAFEDASQALAWTFAYDNPHLLARAPRLEFADGAGGTQGLVLFEPSGLPGVVSFNVTLVDDGASDAAIGDAPASRPASFKLILRHYNQPPRFELAYNLTILQGAGPQTHAGMVTGAVPGPPSEEDQALTFFLDAVESISGSGVPEAGLFVDFAVAPDGSLAFTPAPEAWGAFRVSVGARDSGGTSFGGVDTARRDFLLVVQQAEAAGQRVVLPLDEQPRDVGRVFAGLFSEPPGQLPLYTFSVVGEAALPSMFAEPPTVNGSGAVFFTVRAFEHGTEEVRVLLSMREGNVPVREQVLEVAVAAVNDMPSFEMPAELRVVEGAGRTTVPNFTTSVSPGPPNEAGQTVSFQLTALMEGFFVEEPAISPAGTLTFATRAGSHGLVTVVVRIVDSAMEDVALSSEQLQATTRYLALRIFPLPVLASVSPRLVPTTGRVTVTVRGQHFGSLYSRGYAAPSYGQFAVYIGPDQCRNATYVSDEAVTCEVPPGVGPSQVTFNVSDGALSRAGALPAGVIHSLVIYGGVAADSETAGFIAVGPRRVRAGTLTGASPSLANAGLPLSRGVLPRPRPLPPVLTGHVSSHPPY